MLSVENPNLNRIYDTMNYCRNCKLGYPKDIYRCIEGCKHALAVGARWKKKAKGNERKNKHLNQYK